MKKLLMIMLLTVTVALKAQAGNEGINHTNCVLEYRIWCVDIIGCAMTPYTSAWTTWNPTDHSFGPLPHECGTNSAVVYEVRYAASTGCSTASVFVGPTICSIVPYANLPSCACSPNGIDVQWTGTANLYADPL